MALFRKAGFAVLPWPVDYRTSGREGIGLFRDNPADSLQTTTMAMREWIGLVAYWLSGGSTAVLPGPAGTDPPSGPDGADQFAGAAIRTYIRGVARKSSEVGRCAARSGDRAESPSIHARILSVFLSVFDLFKIGIGPSSSHTMGPMTAAARFLDEIAGGDWPRPAGAKVDRIGASLHGSLAYTGIGHGTDRAVILGLAGLTPITVDPDKIGRASIETIKADKRDLAARPSVLSLRSGRPISCSTRRRRCPAMPTAWPSMPMMPTDRLLLKRIYYSIGGGFVVSDEELQRHEVARRPDKPATSRCPIPSPTPPRCSRWRRQAGCPSPR